MPQVKIKKTIEASRDEVWKFISDIKRAPEWVVVMQSLVETTENPVKEGTVYLEKSQIGPKESQTEWKVIRFDPPTIQIHKCEESDFEATLIMQVTDNKDGTSTLFHTTEYRLMPKLRPLGWLVETLFIKRLMIKSLNETVENCKRLIEKDV